MAEKLARLQNIAPNNVNEEEEEDNEITFHPNVESTRMHINVTNNESSVASGGGAGGGGGNGSKLSLSSKTPHGAAATAGLFTQFLTFCHFFASSFSLLRRKTEDEHSCSGSGPDHART